MQKNTSIPMQHSTETDKPCKQSTRQSLLTLVVCYVLSVGILYRFLPSWVLYYALWSDCTTLYNYLSGSLLWWALILGVGVVAVAWLLAWLVCKMWRKASAWMAIYGSCLVTLGVTLALFGVFGAPTATARFRTLMVMAAQEDWIGIEQYAERYPAKNYIERNLHCMAYAERGSLAARFKKSPRRNVQELFVLDIPNPYVAALLSDVYWTMGEISMSQMYAFEANEKLGNHSSHMLHRLVKTNILYGYYRVAEKYLDILALNPREETFVSRYRGLLTDEAVEADAELRVKRSCIPVMNGFPSSRSVPYDMRRILEQNPEHRASLQYLEAISLL